MLMKVKNREKKNKGKNESKEIRNHKDSSS